MKRILILLCISLFILSSCSSNQVNQNGMDNNHSSKTGKNEVLTIYTISGDENITNAINEYNKTALVAIVEQSFQSKSPEEYNNFKTKLATELLSGAGPDIIRVDPWTFPSIFKAVYSGVFLDMNQLISQDKSINLNDYNTKVLDSGVFDGKRYLMPVEYNLFSPYADTKHMQDAGIDLNKDFYNLNSFIGLINDYMKKRGNKVTCFLHGNPATIFKSILLNSGISFIDYTGKRTNFDTQDFKQLIMLFNDLYPMISGSDILQKFSYLEALEQNITIMADNMWNIPWHRSKNNYKLDMYLFPTYDGTKRIFLEPVKSIGINSNCKFENDAFRFVKQLVSEKCQSVSEGTNTGAVLLPVNTAAYKNNCNFIINNLDIDAADEYGKVKSISNDKERDIAIRKVVDEQYSMMNQIAASQMHDETVINIIWDEVLEVINKKITIEQCVKNLNNKIILYLNE